MNICYLGDSTQEIFEYRKSFPEAETVFLCSNYLQLLRLQSTGERGALYDDDVPADLAWAAQEWLCNLLQSWYLDQEGNDLSTFGEISLGRVAQYLLVQLLIEEMRRMLSINHAIEKYRPEVIAWGPSLGESWDRACAQLASTFGIQTHGLGKLGEHVPRPQTRELPIVERQAQSELRRKRPVFRMWEWLTSTYAILQGKSNNGRAHDVLVVNYANLDPIWREWNSNSNVRKRIKFGFLSTFPPSRGIAVKALMQRCTVYPMVSEPKDMPQGQDVTRVVGVMNTHLESETGRRRFAFGSLNLAPVLTPAFQEAISWVFPMISQMAGSIESAVRRRRPKAVLLPYTSPPNAQILWRLSSIYGFKTVGVEHGVPSSTNQDIDTIFGETWELDRVITPSQADRDVRISWGVPPEKAIVLGSGPAQRALDHIRRQGPQQRSSGNIGQVLVLDYTRHGTILSHKERAGGEYFIKVTELLCQLGFRRITYKLHPGPEHPDYFQQMKPYLSSSARDVDVTIVRDAPMFDLMDQAEFMIGPTGTAILEAAVFDRPYLTVHLDDFPLWPPLDSEDVPVAHNYDELERLIQNRGEFWPQARRAILRNIGGLDPDKPLNGDGFGKKLLQDLSEWLDSA